MRSLTLSSHSRLFTLKILFIATLLSPFTISCADMEELDESSTVEKNYYDTFNRTCYDFSGYPAPCPPSQNGYLGDGVCRDPWGYQVPCGQTIETNYQGGGYQNGGYQGGGNQNGGYQGSPYGNCLDGWGRSVPCNQIEQVQCTDAWGYPEPCTYI